MQQDIIETDVVIVGAGPAGLACAIRLAQLNKTNGTAYKIVVLEKGAYVGAHILSGCLFKPQALTDLIPDWKERGAPLLTPVQEEYFKLFTKKLALSLPIPPPLKNKGHYIISLGLLCQWLAEQAIALGVEIFPGFAAVACNYDQAGNVNGVITGRFGIHKDGTLKPNAQEGLIIRATHTILAEGARGSITKDIIQKYKLQENSASTYGLGFKEIWDSNKLKPGTVIHTVGWPLSSMNYGGGFIYQSATNRLSIGYIVGLDYNNPSLDPYQEFQQFKHHPFVKKILSGYQCLHYGAKAVNEGGWQSLPTNTFPGGLLIGCGAQLLDVGEMKGTHHAIESGKLAAEACFKGLHTQENAQAIYQASFEDSKLLERLYLHRNIRPSFKWGLWPGLVLNALDYYIFKGRQPWTFRYTADHLHMQPKENIKPIVYPRPDNALSFDKLSSLAKSHVAHEDDQPCHLRLQDATTPLSVNYPLYDGPEQRYCPAGVYEYVKISNEIKFVINAQNCLHCKTCDIKDMKQSLKWTPPEGGGGPNYSDM